jgi:hypothetical protein
MMPLVFDYKKNVDHTNGILCKCVDLLSIKSAFISAIHLSINDFAKMGENSRLKMKRLFSQEMILNKWLTIL